MTINTFDDAEGGLWLSAEHGAKSIWIDIETTALKAKEGYIIEFAALAVDNKLNVIDSISSIIYPCDDSGLPIEFSKLEDLIDSGGTRAIHESSGLLADLRNSNSNIFINTSVLKERFVDFIVANELQGVYMGGASVHFDRYWLIEHIGDEVIDLLSHRNIDTTSISEYLRYKGIKVPEHPTSEEFGKPHRALADIYNSLEYFKLLLNVYI